VLAFPHTLFALKFWIQSVQALQRETFLKNVQKVYLVVHINQDLDGIVLQDLHLVQMFNVLKFNLVIEGYFGNSIL